MTTIKEIVAKLSQVNSLEDPIFDTFSKDSRLGVQKAIKSRKKQIQDSIDENLRLEGMLSYERGFYDQGYDLIAGIDEVGRGPLAGPVVAAAVILPKNHKIFYLNDSKKIPKSKHNLIFEQIMAEAISVGIGVVDENVIDEINIYQATKKAMQIAVENLKVAPQALLIDAMKLETLPLPQLSIIKGDANSLSIAAASIVAKVTRDKLMSDYDQVYPGYDFKKNAGYGTKTHLEGLKKYGITPIHRKTFKPIKSMLH